jgi:GntR family transcriptional regulator
MSSTPRAGSPLAPPLDPGSPTPLYHQVFLILRQRILSGELPPGTRLPGEEEVAANWGVSRITAKRALAELARAGLVLRARGRGTTVVERPQGTADRPVAAGLEGLMENLIAIGASTRAEVLSFDYLPAPSEVAEALRLAPGDTVQRVERRRWREDQPFSHIVTHLPEGVGRSFVANDLAQHPILELIEASGHRVGRAEQMVTATLADPELARALQVPIGAALLEVRRVVEDVEGLPVQLIVVRYRPDVYALRMVLDRVGGGGSDGPRLWQPSAM